MAQLSTEQLLYLLYAVAYSTEGTVTKGTVKEHLPKEFKKDADKICDALCTQKLLESPKKGRLSVSEQSRKELGVNLLNTDYEFDTSKGYKVINTILACTKLGFSDAQTSSSSADDMDFDTFVEKFKALYLEERKRQELRGVVAIRSREICQKFMEHNLISQSKLDKYFDLLKSNGQIFAVLEKDDELIQWSE